MSARRRRTSRPARRPGADAARGLVIRTDVTAPSNWRATESLTAWLEARGIVGLAGIDTRALAARIRDGGMMNAVVAHDPAGRLDLDALKARAAAIPDMTGLDLATGAATTGTVTPEGAGWSWPDGFGTATETPFHVVALDYGCKRNILRCLADVGCKVTVVGPDESAEAILAREPDGIFLANGPGDPAATGETELPKLRALVESGVPLFGICLGHQMLALALGASTVKMRQGHHGANHPVKDHTTGKVEIVSMNHGFAVDAASLPEGVEETHTSLFDGSNCGLRLVGKPVFSVQHHPEASPGPRDSHYLFRRFRNLMAERKKGMDAIPEEARMTRRWPRETAGARHHAHAAWPPDGAARRDLRRPRRRRPDRGVQCRLACPISEGCETVARTREGLRRRRGARHKPPPDAIYVGGASPTVLQPPRTTNQRCEDLPAPEPAQVRHPFAVADDIDLTVAHGSPRAE